MLVRLLFYFFQLQSARFVFKYGLQLFKSQHQGGEIVHFYTVFKGKGFAITNKHGKYSKRKTTKSKWVN